MQYHRNQTRLEGPRSRAKVSDVKLVVIGPKRRKGVGGVALVAHSIHSGPAQKEKRQTGQFIAYIDFCRGEEKVPNSELIQGEMNWGQYS